VQSCATSAEQTSSRNKTTAGPGHRRDFRDGEEVMAYLKESQPHTLRQVIVMTASPRRLSCEFLERICKILTKPFDVEELVLMARECVQDPTSSCSSPD